MDAELGQTIASASTCEKGLERKGFFDAADARTVGERLGARCSEAGITRTVHRRQAKFHGKYREFILGFAEAGNITIHSAQKPFQD